MTNDFIENLLLKFTTHNTSSRISNLLRKQGYVYFQTFYGINSHFDILWCSTYFIVELLNTVSWCLFAFIKI